VAGTLNGRKTLSRRIFGAILHALEAGVPALRMLRLSCSNLMRTARSAGGTFLGHTRKHHAQLAEFLPILRDKRYNRFQVLRI